MPSKVHEVAVLDENHLCVIIGFVLRIYEINEQGLILIAQTKVGLFICVSCLVYRFFHYNSSCDS